MKRVLLSLVMFLAACGAVTPVPESPTHVPVLPTPSEVPATTAAPTATSTVATYQIGEPVPFSIDDTVYLCHYFYDEIPYTIVQVTAAGEREVALRHSCTGFIAQGVDEYCEDGKVKTVNVAVGECSDEVGCGETAVNETFTWDQREYVVVTEACAGETIRREEVRQVPAGEYKIVVQQQTETEEIVTNVIKEFVISE